MYAAILLFSFLICCHGNVSTETQRVLDEFDKSGMSLDKRSDGLMAELVHILVHQSGERKDILKRCNVTEKRAYKLNKDLDGVKQSVDQLKLKTETQQTETQKQIKQLKKTTIDLARIVRKHSNQMAMMQHQVRVLEKIIGELGKSNGTGFSVRFVRYKANVSPYTFSRGDMVKFNHVISNYGNSYNMATGKFRCTKPGLYMFHVTAISISNFGSVLIVKNKSDLVEAFASGGKLLPDTEKRFESGSTSTVLRLKIGDEIWIKAGNGEKVVLEWYSSFSGVYISK